MCVCVCVCVAGGRDWSADPHLRLQPPAALAAYNSAPAAFDFGEYTLEYIEGGGLTGYGIKVMQPF